MLCRISTCQVCRVYGSDVLSFSHVEFLRVHLGTCTNMMCRVDVLSISDFLSFLCVRFSCMELMLYRVLTWRICCVYGLNLSDRCCVEFAVYDCMCRVETV